MRWCLSRFLLSRMFLSNRIRAALGSLTRKVRANSYNPPMRKRRIAQIVVLLLLTIFLLAPVYEHFDHWDGFPQGGDDTVLSLIAVVTISGVVLVATRSLFRVFLQRCWVKPERWKSPSVIFVFLACRAADESPPSSLRLSLLV
jgi:protein-S-isoprenylcysteine O-methyltransferase Ste14